MTNKPLAIFLLVLLFLIFAAAVAALWFFVLRGKVGGSTTTTPSAQPANVSPNAVAAPAVAVAAHAFELGKQGFLHLRTLIN